MDKEENRTMIDILDEGILKMDHPESLAKWYEGLSEDEKALIQSCVVGQIAEAFAQLMKVAQEFLDALSAAFREILDILCEYHETLTREFMRWRFIEDFRLPFWVASWLANIWPKSLLPRDWAWEHIHSALDALNVIVGVDPPE